MQKRRFTKEFEAEAVRLPQTSGRTQREVAGDLGIGLSTLVRDATVQLGGDPRRIREAFVGFQKYLFTERVT
jgi:transposase-like protein